MGAGLEPESGSYPEIKSIAFRVNEVYGNLLKNNLLSYQIN
jgi:hypothetical protein